MPPVATTLDINDPSSRDADFASSFEDLLKVNVHPSTRNNRSHIYRSHIYSQYTETQSVLLQD